MKKKSLYNFCINDIILAAAIFIITAALFLVFSLVKNKTDGDTVRITISGNVYGEYSLNENKTIDIANESGTNVIVIENGKVHMENADCPDRYCVSSGAICRNGETIVCLPHKLVAEVVKGDDEDEFDAVVQ